MKFLQTFWTGPSGIAKENLISMKAGWLSCEYHWMSWALSCLQAKNIFGEINLVTDIKGKELLIDQFQLPYSTVSTTLEHTLDHYHPSLWALAKIYTYSIQTEPFLHLDGDVYIWHKPNEALLNARLIAQNMDKNLAFYSDTLNEINAHFTHIPSPFLKENYENKDIYGSNAGLLGGSDLSFFNEYSRLAFEFIDKNADKLDKLNISNLNFIFEQYLFCQLANKVNTPISYYKEVVDDPVFKDYIKFEDFPHVQMVHPVGGFKKYQHVCDHVAKKLRKDYPEYYYRIINMVRESGVNMRSAIYYSPQLKLDTLPSLLTEITLKLPKAKPLFERTQAAINYLNTKQLISKEIDLNDKITKNNFTDQRTLILPDGTEKNRLLEIFRMESERNSLIKKLYTKPTSAVSKLYEEDVKTYQQIQEIFSLPESDLMNIKIGTPENCMLINLCWDWKYDHKEDIPAIMERNFNEEKSLYSVLLLPDVLQGNIKEYYFDELEIIIFNTVKKILTIEETLQKMKQYFPEEEIEEDYLLFKSLIIKTVKRLLYMGVVNIIF